MRRPYPNRRRKRKGRPPPHRYKGDGFPIRPNSFQDFGLKAIYDLFLPKLGVHNRRRYFNQVGSFIVLGMGVFGSGYGFRDGWPCWRRSRRRSWAGTRGSFASEAPVYSLKSLL